VAAALRHRETSASRTATGLQGPDRAPERCCPTVPTEAPGTGEIGEPHAGGSELACGRVGARAR